MIQFYKIINLYNSYFSKLFLSLRLQSWRDHKATDYIVILFSYWNLNKLWNDREGRSLQYLNLKQKKNSLKVHFAVSLTSKHLCVQNILLKLSSIWFDDSSPLDSKATPPMQILRYLRLRESSVIQYCICLDSDSTLDFISLIHNPQKFLRNSNSGFG